MSQPSNIFRKVSLERLASPEQLDQLMRVTDARGWVALAGLGLILLTAVGWWPAAFRRRCAARACS